MTEATDNEYREQRLANMKKLVEMGHKPFGHAFQRSGRLADIRAGFEENKRVTAAGRLLTIRGMGKSTFAHLADGSDRLQVYASQKDLGDTSYQAFKLLDMGDHIGVDVGRRAGLAHRHVGRHRRERRWRLRPRGGGWAH